MKKYNLGWIFAQTKDSRRYLVLLAAAGIASAAVNISTATILKGFVDIATGDSPLTLGQNVALAVICQVLGGVAGLATSVSFQTSCNKIGKKMRLSLAGRLYHSSLLEMQAHHVGEYMTNLTADVEKVSACFPLLVRDTVCGALSAVLSIGYLFFFNWKLALLLLICIPLLIFCVSVFSPVLQRASRRDRESEEEIRVYFQDVLEKIALFKIGGMGKKMAGKADDLLTRKIRTARVLGVAEGGSGFLNNVMGAGMFLIALGGGAYFVLRGELAVGAMIAVIQLSNYIIWPFTAIGGIISNVNQSIVSAERLDRIYSLTEEREPSGAPQEPVEALRLTDVSFAYGETPVFSQVGGEFAKNQIVGIVGESGGGKSTLLKVLAGLYPPSEGKVQAVLSGGIPWRSPRPYVGLVPPSGLVFRDTIANNICMAKERDDQRLRQCAVLANIDRYIDSLEKGFDTLVGDGEQALSSGQEQRLGIARALYQGAEILLFDEPTANLDAESIDVFLETLEQIAPSHVCILVTHDPRVTTRCHRVLELRDGYLAARAGL